MKFRNVVLVDGARSGFARGGRGKLVATRLDDVGAKVLRTLLERNPKVKDTMIQDVGLGNVAGRGEFTGLAHIARLAGLPHEVCGFNTQRQCGSSMEALHKIASAIALGSLDCGVSLGIERMGTTLGGGGGGGPRGPAPKIDRFGYRRIDKNDVQRNMASDHGEYFSVPFPDYILDSPTGQSMLQTAQNVAEVYGITREELDAFSAKSHQDYVKARENGIYKDEIVPLEVEDPVYDDERKWVEDEKGPMITFDTDECVRDTTTAEVLAGLNPVRGYQSWGGKDLLITAGNSCPTNDGVSCSILMAEEMALALGIEPIARIIGMAVGGVKPQLMGIGPIVSSKKALANAGIEAAQIDRCEFNEAFAAQVIPSVKDIGLNPDCVNVNGGSIGIGHPLGATGTRLVVTVAKELRRSNTKYGLATQCIGAGMGITTIVENLDV